MFILQENIRTALFPCRIAEDGTAPPGGKVRWQVMDIMQKLHIEFVATHRKVYFSCFLIRSVLWPKSPQDKGMSDGLISQLPLAWWGMQMIGGNI